MLVMSTMYKRATLQILVKLVEGLHKPNIELIDHMIDYKFINLLALGIILLDGSWLIGIHCVQSHIMFQHS